MGHGRQEREEKWERHNARQKRIPERSEKSFKSGEKFDRNYSHQDRQKARFQDDDVEIQDPIFEALDFGEYSESPSRSDRFKRSRSLQKK